jgi:hypothetical protein
MAAEVPAITAEFVAAEPLVLGPRWYRQEYECSFEATSDSVFDPEVVATALEAGERPKPLWSDP